MFVSKGPQYSSSSQKECVVTVAKPVENPLVEEAPDFSHKTCKDYREEVIGETQKGEEDGLEQCTFPSL
jgi:hypothetical protein